MKAKIFKYKNYKHIDKKCSIKRGERFARDREFVKTHGFYPFIHYDDVTRKFVFDPEIGGKGLTQPKERPIEYASHIDRYIYQWYGHELNEKYNEYVERQGFSNGSIAYRTSFTGKTNIEFAKQAIDFIKKCDECFIIVSDFSKFFEHIEHNALKERICRVMGMKRLDDDWYKVFRSLTRYSYVYKRDIENFLIENNYETEKSLKKNNSFFDNVKWSDVKDQIKINTNEEGRGIPQGSPMSGVLANVYMIDFDKKVTQYVREKGGLYMRYSDDVIIIIPCSLCKSHIEIWEQIKEIKNDYYPTLVMNDSKTSIYLYKNKSITSLHETIKNIKKGNKFITYLGFSFDGKEVSFRDKTIGKFYRKLYKKANRILRKKNQISNSNKEYQCLVTQKDLRKIFGPNERDHRIFMDYVHRACRVFKDERQIRQLQSRAKTKFFNKLNKNQ